MPELPEVETIRLSLEKKILGLTIKDVQVLNAKSFVFGEKPFDSAQGIKGAKVVKVWRRAKVLGIDLQPSSLRASAKPASTQRGEQSSQVENFTQIASSSMNGVGTPRNDETGTTLLFHLKMSGQVIFIGNSQKAQGNSPADTNAYSLNPTASRFVGGHPTKDMLLEMPNKHTRVIFEFADGSHLYFNDQRKFGWIRISNKTQVTSDKFFKKLGPEPLGKSFTREVLKINLLVHKKTSVKVALLDQTVIAGVGNIYACEALFLAKINPKVKVTDLSDVQIKNLHKAIIQALSDGIKYGGSTRTHFVDSDGKKGLFLDYANVYNRAGKPCKVCGTKIEKIKLGGRGTFFCPQCQK